MGTLPLRGMEESDEVYIFYILTRVARWFDIKPKISIWVHLGAPCIDWKIYLWPFGIFYGD
jgi:hypothetical protein